MMVPKFVDIWVADAEGSALAGPILGELRWRDERAPSIDTVDIAVAPVKGTVVEVPINYAHPLMIQAYDLDDDETLLGWWPLWMTFTPGASLSLQPWMRMAR